MLALKATVAERVSGLYLEESFFFLFFCWNAPVALHYAFIRHECTLKTLSRLPRGWTRKSHVPCLCPSLTVGTHTHAHTHTFSTACGFKELRGSHCASSTIPNHTIHTSTLNSHFSCFISFTRLYWHVVQIYTYILFFTKNNNPK